MNLREYYYIPSIKINAKVADLVEGVTKISVFENQAIADQDKKKFTKAENFRKLIIATSKDIRVLLVKLAVTAHCFSEFEFGSLNPSPSLSGYISIGA